MCVCNCMYIYGINGEVPHFRHPWLLFSLCRCGSAEQPGLLPRLLDDLFFIKAREHWRSEIHFDAWLKGKRLGKGWEKDGDGDVILAYSCYDVVTIILLVFVGARKCSGLELRRVEKRR